MSYADLIREAVPEATRKQVKEIEEAMRDEVFHSTLDWQTREQLIQGAQQAWKILKEEAT